MSAEKPDWDTMPEPVKQRLRLIISAIREELEDIELLGEAHPHSAFRMGNIINRAQEFGAIIHRVEGANNADFYAYECYRKEHP